MNKTQSPDRIVNRCYTFDDLADDNVGAGLFLYANTARNNDCCRVQHWKLTGMKTPTIDPTPNPTTPTQNPSFITSADPTIHPTNNPTSDPTMDPTSDPTSDRTIYSSNRECNHITQ